MSARCPGPSSRSTARRLRLASLHRHLGEGFIVTITRALVIAALVLAATAAWAADLTVAKPEQVGLSSERLARITELLRTDVEKGRLPGAVALVARKGRIAYFEAVGFRDKAAGTPLRKDDIFRIWVYQAIND